MAGKPPSDEAQLSRLMAVFPFHLLDEGTMILQEEHEQDAEVAIRHVMAGEPWHQEGGFRAERVDGVISLFYVLASAAGVE